MARNESVVRMVMFLCFGTAILLLVVHWYTMKTKAQLNPSVSTTLRKNSPVRSHSSQNPTVGKSYVAEATDTSINKKTVVQKLEQDDQTEKIPQRFLFPGVAEAKSVQGLESNRTQVVVDLSDRRVYVYQYDQVIASYPIAVGKKGWETPTGTFQVIHKEHHPIWKHPITGQVFEAGTNSPLGDRWIGFWSDGRNEIGFHGTPNTDLVGAAVSHGCLRMRNSDVRMLYDQVNLTTPVLVRD